MITFKMTKFYAFKYVFNLILYLNFSGIAPIQTKHSIVRPLTMNDNLKCIIYESDPGVHIKSSVNLESPHKEMLKFSVHVVRSQKQQIKVNSLTRMFHIYSVVLWWPYTAN